MGTKEHGKMLKRTQILEEGKVPAKEAKHRKIEGIKKGITGKEHRRLLNEFDMGGFMAQRRSVESRKRENTAGQRCIVQGRR